jgi:hypothetical protein
MHILVLHRNKFERMGYDVAIDHDEHDVVYAGTRQYVENIPPGVRCRTVVYEDGIPLENQLRPWLAARCGTMLSTSSSRPRRAPPERLGAPARGRGPRPSRGRPDDLGRVSARPSALVILVSVARRSSEWVAAPSTGRRA